MINVAAIRMQQFGVQFYQASLTAGDIDKLVRFEVLNYGDAGQSGVRGGKSGGGSKVNWDLLERRIAAGGASAAKFWSWIAPFDASSGYQHEPRRQLDALVRGDDILRREVQRHVLLDLPGEQNVWQREWRLSKRIGGLSVTPEDVIALLDILDPADRTNERWREVIQLTRHEGEIGAAVRAAARPFAAHRSDLIEWIDHLAEPHTPRWQTEEAERKRKRRAKQATKQAEHRKSFAAQVDRMRAGDGGVLVGPAMAYLKLFDDIGDETPAHERVQEWLGDDISEAAHAGFDAFLKIDPPVPSAQEIAEAFAQDQRWDFSYIVVVALAERRRKEVGLDDLSDERLMAGLFELLHSKIDDHAGIGGLEEAIAAAVQARGIWASAMRLYCEPQLERRRPHIDGLYALMRDDSHVSLGVELASEWLDRFPDLPHGPESELVDRLLRSGQFDPLRRAAADRLHLTDDERRRNWDAIGLIVAFEQTSERLGRAPIETALIWSLQNHTGGRFGDGPNAFLGVTLLEWIVATFRLHWPVVGHPNGVMNGDKNPWDASDFLAQLIRRLGNDACDDAVAALGRLRDAPADGYTEMIRMVAAEQARIRVEAAYVAPSLDAINAIARNRPPIIAVDLQASMIEELRIVQAKIKNDDAESWRGFFDDNKLPFAEERCRDHLLGLLRQSCEGITLDPEAHVAADKEVDIACSVGELRMPIEVKGQWHPKLWQGADAQLDRLYAQDWRAGGLGIYLVLWFGEQQANKRLANPTNGAKRPQTPDDLCDMLTAGSMAASEGRVVVVVLDLSRP